MPVIQRETVTWQLFAEFDVGLYFHLRRDYGCFKSKPGCLSHGVVPPTKKQKRILGQSRMDGMLKRKV